MRHILTNIGLVLLLLAVPMMSFDRSILVSDCTCDHESEEICSIATPEEVDNRLPECCVLAEPGIHEEHESDDHCCMVMVQVPGIQTEFIQAGSNLKIYASELTLPQSADDLSVEQIPAYSPAGPDPPPMLAGLELLIHLHQLRIAVS